MADCGVVGCTAPAPLFPVCTQHAEELMGLEVRESRMYALRRFDPGELLAPVAYAAAVRSCDQAGGTANARWMSLGLSRHATGGVPAPAPVLLMASVFWNAQWKGADPVECSEWLVSRTPIDAGNEIVATVGMD